MTELYLQPEDKARHEIINPKLKLAGWEIQHFSTANIYASKGVAVEYFQMGKGVGEADYVLFVDGMACGIIEAKRVGTTLVGKEPQSNRYASGFPTEFQLVDLPLPFVYESTGEETRFTNLWDPKPRSREVFHFHKPETLAEWIKNGENTFRRSLIESHPLENKKLWDVQQKAILNLEESMSLGKPKALIQMATGSGKTFTAVNFCYRFIKNAGAKKILFLVDRANLGKQAELEFENFVIPNDGRKFTELYNIQRLTGNAIDDVSRVYISTIQRIYSMLKGEELEESEDEISDYEKDLNASPPPVEYNPNIPIEMFDIIIVDECHRSIYNLWRQVLDYFDGFLIGLTATPSKQTIGFFDKNLVMSYSHEEAVADMVNVDFNVYSIRTKITEEGSVIEAGQVIQKRDKRTRKKRWETLNDEVTYDKSKLDRDVVAKDQIRTVVRTFKEKALTEIFPGRKHIPKTLIFAKDDNHAEEIVQIVREEFNEGNNFAVKITYKTEGESPDALIRQFANDFNPRIAVTVDMIATGTDIKPLEIVFFMRTVKSRNYFEQMKGRGVRVMKNDDFRAITPDAVAKEGFVIVDAVGVTDKDNDLSDTRPLEQKPLVSFEKLLKAIRFSKPNADNLSSMASRLIRLEKKLTAEQREEINAITDGLELSDIAKGFIDAINPDAIFEQAKVESGKESGSYISYEPTLKEIEVTSQKRMIEAMKPLIGNPKLLERLPEIKKETEQIIDDISIDEITHAGFSQTNTEKAKDTIQCFKTFIDENKDELTAIQVFYKNKNLQWSDLKELVSKIKIPPYSLTSSKLWEAYSQLEMGKVNGKAKGKPADFVSLLRFELGKANKLEPFSETVNRRFNNWLLKQQSLGAKFSPEQLEWLEKIKDHIAESIDITPDDFEDNPVLYQMGGLGGAYETFGPQFNQILQELNQELSV